MDAKSKIMKRLLFVYLSLILPILNQGCTQHDPNSVKQLKPTTFDAHYRKIDFYNFIEKHKNDSLDFYEELLNDKQFVNVLEHGDYYKNDVISFLTNKKFNAMQVEVCICAMQNLNLNDYVTLCNIILSLYNDNKLSEGVLEDSISPDFLRKRIVINNYSDPGVVKLLKSIRDNKKVVNKNFRASLPDILSGKSAKELKEFDENQ